MIDLRDSTDPDIGVAAGVLSALDVAARAAGVTHMVVGATARNVISIGLLGRLPDRSTRDVDIAVAVDSWSDFQRLADRLPRKGRRVHTFVVEGVEVGIEATNRTLMWPDEVRMNVLALSEVAAGAQRAVLPGGVIVVLPTIPGLAALKLVTWSDRHLATRVDAVDLDTIIGWYSVGPFLDEAYADVEVLAANGFDPELAGAHRLGVDITSLLGSDAASALDAILTDAALARLANDMPTRVVDHHARLSALRAGVRS